MQSRKGIWLVGAIITAILVVVVVLQAQFFIDARAKRLGEPINPAPNSTNPATNFDLTNSFTAATLLAANMEELSGLAPESQRVGVDADVNAIAQSMYGQAMSATVILRDWLSNESHQGIELDVPEPLAEMRPYARQFVFKTQTQQERTTEVAVELKRLLADFNLIRAQYDNLQLDVDVRQALTTAMVIYESSRTSIEKLAD